MLRRIGLFAAPPLLALAAWPALADYAGGVRAWGRGDLAAATREFLPPAQAGDAESQYMMGRLLALGDDTPRDWVQAWAWYDRAARQGHADARKARESMESVLTPRQLAVARGLAAPPPLPQPTAPPPPQQSAAAPGDIPATVENRPVVLVPRSGVVGLSAPGPSEEGRLAAAGTLEEQVRLVQQRLNEAGYGAGPADGVPGPQTRDAIRAWQRRHGMGQTGIVTAELMDSLGVGPQQAAR